jgi:hypothetical protein
LVAERQTIRQAKQRRRGISAAPWTLPSFAALLTPDVVARLGAKLHANMAEQTSPNRAADVPSKLEERLKSLGYVE